MDGVEGAVVPPLVEVAPDGALGREVLGQVTPLAAGAQDVEDGIDDVAQVGLAGPAAGVDGQVRLDQGPLRVGDVAGVGLRSHTSFYASTPLMGQSLRFAKWVANCCKGLRAGIHHLRARVPFSRSIVRRPLDSVNLRANNANADLMQSPW